MRLCKPQPSLPPPAVFHCDKWNSLQVIEWLKGVDDSIVPYLKTFAEQNIDGGKLMNLDSDTLKQMGINKEVTRSRIMAAINLLVHYSYTIKHENLQKLALQASLAATELLNGVSCASPIINNSQNVSKHIEVLNRVLRAVSDVYESVVCLIFWLERNPFVVNVKFTKLRNELSSCIDGMVDCVNNPNNPKFFSVPQVFVERANVVQSICKQILFMNDPSVLYTAFLDRVTVRRTVCTDWGFDVGRTCLGLNLITWVDHNSAAVLSDRLDVGDEILEIDGYPVVGWRYVNLVRRLNSNILMASSQSKYPTLQGNSSELQLLLCKRPRDPDTWKDSPLRASKILLHNIQRRSQRFKHKYLDRIAEDTKGKLGTDLASRMTSNIVVPTTTFSNADQTELRRSRSSSFAIGSTGTSVSNKKCNECSLPQTTRCISLLMPSTGKKQLFRRASVWNESPPAALRSPFDGIQSETNSWLLLLASWGGNKPRTERPMELQPQNTFQLHETFGNGVSILVEEEANNGGAIKEHVADDIAFTEIELLCEAELELLHVGDVLTVDPEWNAPIREITGLLMQRRSHLDSGSPMIDSPLSNIHAKIARFFHTDFALPNAATPPASLTPPVESTLSIAVRSETQECRTPITPNSKISLESPLSARTTGEDVSNIGSFLDSPSSCSLMVKTIASRRRLAPLAEPDDIGDLSFAFSPTSNKDVDGSALPIASISIDNSKAQAQHHYDFCGWIRFIVSSKSSEIDQKRWIKCWARVKNSQLYVHATEESSEASFVINLKSCSICKNKHMKTSKKHTFTINSGDQMKIQFAASSYAQLRAWRECLLPYVTTGADESSGSSSAFTDISGMAVASSSPTNPINTMRSFFSRVSLRGSMFRPKHS